jgi:hypothetical protein
MTKNEVNIEEMLREDYKVPESVFDRKRTKTSHFMMPSIFPSNSILGTEYFVNAFVDDGGYEHRLDRVIFVLFKTDARDPKWQMLNQRLRAKTEYILEYFCGLQDGKHLIMMVFRIPEKFINDYINFLDGKYSKFSEEYKKLFPRHAYNERNQPIESTIWRVIHKSEDLKKELEKFFTVDTKGTHQTKFGPDDELWGIPEPKYEVYRYV